MKVELLLGERRLAVDLKPTKEGQQVQVADLDFAALAERTGGGRILLRQDERCLVAWAAHQEGAIHVAIGGETFTFRRAERQRQSKGDGAADALGGVAEIRPPMPGKVVKVKVAPGEQVVRGQVVVIVEAMKMEVELPSPIAGTVTEVNAAAGELVDTARPLVVIQASPAPEPAAGKT